MPKLPLANNLKVCYVLLPFFKTITIILLYNKEIIAIVC